jgi:hypothetical protein
LNKLVENPINDITNEIRHIIEYEFEPEVTTTISSNTRNLLDRYDVNDRNGVRIIFGGTKDKSYVHNKPKSGGRNTVATNIVNNIYDLLNIAYTSRDLLNCLFIANKIMDQYIYSSNNRIDVILKVAVLTEFISVCEILYLLNEIRLIYDNSRQDMSTIDDRIKYYNDAFNTFGSLFNITYIRSRQDLMWRIYGTHDTPFESINNVYNLIKVIPNIDLFPNYPDYYDIPDEIVSVNPSNSRDYNYSPYYSDYEVIIRDISITMFSNGVAHRKTNNANKGINERVERKKTHANTRRNKRIENYRIVNVRRSPMQGYVGGRKKSHRPRNMKKNKTRKIRRKTLKLR